jgi:hypothetical protein
MPEHFIVLRRQDGDAWDYVAITHLGPQATVEAAGIPAVPSWIPSLAELPTETVRGVFHRSA